MRNKHRYNYIVLAAIILIQIFAGTSAAYSGNNPKDLLDKFRDHMLQVHDYKAKVNIRVDVDFINIKDRKAVVFFEQPDKFEFSAGGFALLPRKGMEMEYLELLQTDYSAINAGTKTIDSVQTQMVKVIPNNDSLDIVLAKMYLNPETHLLHRMKTFTKESGSYTINFSYAGHPYDLPDQLEIIFDVKNQKLPVSLTGDMKSIGKEIKESKKRARVIIDYSEYVVNRKKD
ncbi:MAG: hypothetical protein K9I68_01065 [Bacteroidales bacterium]|nr:hypothetical protein [Bacteroidales bacterium]MCF8338585.1 hypothetical protein [Bacteroidales bacterium]